MLHVYQVIGYGSHGRVFLASKTNDKPFKSNFEKLQYIFDNPQEFRKMYKKEYNQDSLAAKIKKTVKSIDKKLYAVKISCPSAEYGEYYGKETKHMAKRIIRNEIKILSKLNHPSVISLIGKIKYKKWIGMIMDFYPDIDLYSKVDSLTFFEMKQIFKKLALAGAYLARHGIVHVDIKVENVLLDAKNHPVLSDFGLALELGEKEFVLQDKIYGTLSCQAPEVVADFRYSEKSDVWAYGILMYECIYGKSPFFYNSDDECINAIVSQNIKYPRKEIKILGVVIASPRLFLESVLCFDYRARKTFGEISADKWWEE